MPDFVNSDGVTAGKEKIYCELLWNECLTKGRSGRCLNSLNGKAVNCEQRRSCHLLSYQNYWKIALVQSVLYSVYIVCSGVLVSHRFRSTLSALSAHYFCFCTNLREMHWPAGLVSPFTAERWWWWLWISSRQLWMIVKYKFEDHMTGEPYRSKNVPNAKSQHWGNWAIFPEVSTPHNEGSCGFLTWPTQDSRLVRDFVPFSHYNPSVPQRRILSRDIRL